MDVSEKLKSHTQGRFRSQKVKKLIRAIALILPASCYVSQVNAWCINQVDPSGGLTSDEGQHFGSSSSLSRCSAPPTFLSFRRRHSSSALFVSPSSKRRPQSQVPYSDDDNYPRRKKSVGRPRTQQNRNFDSYYDQDEDDPYAVDLEDDNEYYDERDEIYYNKENEYYGDRIKTIEWEEVQVPNLRTSRDMDDESSPSYSTVYVLLPPSPPAVHPLPSAVLHFVGGTLFGSSPKIFYRFLLEDIVRHTQCAIVVTPVPVVTPFNSRQTQGPLNHVQMARNLQHQFQYAYEQVLEDEYESQPMKSVPIAGLGHSLGARLLVVLATLMMKDGNSNKNNNTYVEDNNQQRRRRWKVDAPNYQYKSMILVSFTNFGASAGIPGISSLLKQRRQLEERNKQRRRRPNSNRRDEELLQQRRRRRSNKDFYDDEDDDDDDDDILEDWAELWTGIQGVLLDQADRVKTRLTPLAEDLEFYPTPRQLWTALEGDLHNGQESQYRIPQTLLIQFDRDDVDQSAKLATAFVAKHSYTTSATTSEANDASVISPGNKSDNAASETAKASTATVTPSFITDLKFARLRGTHLTPVTLASSSELEDTMMAATTPASEQSSLREWTSKSAKAVWNYFQGRIVGGKTEGGNMSQDEALLALRQTITRYIADVVKK